YYVGASADQIVVFQGIDTEIGPFQFFKVVKGTNLSVSSLSAVQQGRVRNHIPVANVDAGLTEINKLKAEATAASQDQGQGQKEPKNPPKSPTPTKSVRSPG